MYRLTKELSGRHTGVCCSAYLVICAGGLRCLCETETITGRPDAASRRTFCLFVLVLAACACACSGWPPGLASETMMLMLSGPTPPPPLALSPLRFFLSTNSIHHPFPPTHHTQTRHSRISLDTILHQPCDQQTSPHPPARSAPAALCKLPAASLQHHPVARLTPYRVLRGRLPPTHALKEAVHSPEFMYSSHAHAFALDPPPEQPQPFRITRRSRLSSHNSTNG